MLTFYVAIGRLKLDLTAFPRLDAWLTAIIDSLR